MNLDLDIYIYIYNQKSFTDQYLAHLLCLDSAHLNTKDVGVILTRNKYY